MIDKKADPRPIVRDFLDEPASADWTGVPPIAEAGSPSASADDRLLFECAAFAGAHESVLVTPDAERGGAIGYINHDAAPGDFMEFLELIGRLSDKGVDVSAVRVTQDGDGVPAAVTFPVFPATKEK